MLPGGGSRNRGVARAARRRGLSIKVNAPNDDIVVMADQRALRQIVINLANNAIKFTERGSVTIDISQLGTNGHTQTRIAVVDTGVGIRKQDHDKLFNAFSRVDGPVNRREEGTGLGLHLSQKLAGLIGGTISFESELGQGSTFTLTMDS